MYSYWNFSIGVDEVRLRFLTIFLLLTYNVNAAAVLHEDAEMPAFYGVDEMFEAESKEGSGDEGVARTGNTAATMASRHGIFIGDRPLGKFSQSKQGALFEQQLAFNAVARVEELIKQERQKRRPQSTEGVDEEDVVDAEVGGLVGLVATHGVPKKLLDPYSQAVQTRKQPINLAGSGDSSIIAATIAISGPDAYMDVLAAVGDERGGENPNNSCMGSVTEVEDLSAVEDTDAAEPVQSRGGDALVSGVDSSETEESTFEDNSSKQGKRVVGLRSASRVCAVRNSSAPLISGVCEIEEAGIHPNKISRGLESRTRSVSSQSLRTNPLTMRERPEMRVLPAIEDEAPSTYPKNLSALERVQRFFNACCGL